MPVKPLDWLRQVVASFAQAITLKRCVIAGATTWREHDAASRRDRSGDRDACPVTVDGKLGLTKHPTVPQAPAESGQAATRVGETIQ